VNFNVSFDGRIKAGLLKRMLPQGWPFYCHGKFPLIFFAGERNKLIPPYQESLILEVPQAWKLVVNKSFLFHRGGDNDSDQRLYDFTGH